jgi:DNA-binding transcriptional MerR regulator
MADPRSSTSSSSSSSSCAWRIDELAQRAQLPVDTIRYYAREGLLPPSVPSGRNRLYGAAHLERLQRVRELQERRFSLAAIREIVSADRPGIAGLFLGTEQQYDFDGLVERSGLDPTFVRRMIEVGLLADPPDVGRDSYDGSDLTLLQSVRELLDIGMTEDIVVELGKIYVHHFRALQRDVHDMLSGKGQPWALDEMEAIQKRLTANAARMLPAVDRVLGYVHQRTVQRLTLEAIRVGQETGTGVGGVKIDPADATNAE